MTILYDGGFSESDRLTFKAKVHENAVTFIQTLIEEVVPRHGEF
jgi:hypothetical protein